MQDGDKDNVGIPHGKVYVPLHSNYDNQYYAGKRGSWYHSDVPIPIYLFI